VNLPAADNTQTKALLAPHKKDFYSK